MSNNQLSATERKALAAELHQAMTTHGELLFTPTGGAFLRISLERLNHLKTPLKPPETERDITDADLWGVYAQWHESVHLAQLVTCTYLFTHGIRIASLAMNVASTWSQEPHDDPKFIEMLNEYESERLALSAGVPGYTPLNIMETHAVCLGLRWLTGSTADGDSLLGLANRLYKHEPQYMNLLNSVARSVGANEAFAVLPGLCYLALQPSNPTTRMLELLARLADESSTADICALSPREFCEWAGVDPGFVSRSLRERIRSETELSRLADHPWLDQFAHQFDAFESVTDLDSRLELLFGTSGGRTYSVFHPNYFVFPGGVIAVSGGTAQEEDFWLRRTLKFVDGLRILKQECRPLEQARVEPESAARQNRALDALAQIAFNRGRLEIAEEYLHLQMQEAIKLNDFVNEACCSNNLAFVTLEQNDLNSALRFASQTISICNGDPEKEPITIAVRSDPDEEQAESTREIAICNLLAREFEENLEVAFTQGMRLRDVLASSHFALGRIARTRRQLVAAKEEFLAALAVYEQNGHLSGAKHAREALAEIAAAQLSNETDGVHK